SSAFWTMRSNWRVRGRARVSLKHLSMVPMAILLLPPMPGSEYVLPVLTMSGLMLGFWTAREVSAPDKNKPPTATPIKTDAVVAIPMSRIFTLPLGSSTFLRGDPQPTLNRRSPAVCGSLPPVYVSPLLVVNRYFVWFGVKSLRLPHSSPRYSFPWVTFRPKENRALWNCGYVSRAGLTKEAGHPGDISAVDETVDRVRRDVVPCRRRRDGLAGRAGDERE